MVYQYNSPGQIPGSRYSFAVRTVENWNKLPEDVKTSRNGEEFKNKLKKL